MNFRAKPIGFRYPPMIVEGGTVKVMVYDHQNELRSSLEVRSYRSGVYLILGVDPGRGKSVSTKVVGISAFDAASKYCAGLLL